MNFVSLRNMHCGGTAFYARAGALDALQLTRLLGRDGSYDQDRSVGLAITWLAVDISSPGFQKPNSSREACGVGRGPSGQRNRRSLASIGASLMLAMRRRIRPSSSNSQFSLP